MMNTPIFDFLRDYNNCSPSRLHMPGHKGKGPLGIEAYDITEIHGADVLYHEDGILKESQKNASLLFGSAKTLYSTEGSTLAIRGMLTLAVQYAKSINKDPIIAATRNAHKSFLTTCALLDIKPRWISSETPNSVLRFKLGEKSLTSFFENCTTLPVALYLTCPDYLGNLPDLEKISSLCKKFGVLLLVDNAHGAYLGFLPENKHPLFLGADLCCDSAHKTLPVLTGGAYLHISKNAPKFFFEQAEKCMSLYASTSPSYLILASLDLCNRFLADGFQVELSSLCEEIYRFKKVLKQIGIPHCGDEPTKICILPKFFGYTGVELANLLRKQNTECEFADPDHMVLMFSVNSTKEDLLRCEAFFRTLPKKDPILKFPPIAPTPKPIFSPREALFSPSETIPTEQSLGRVLSDPCVTCPPAIPILLCGERIDHQAIEAFQYYGIETIRVLKEF